MIDEMFSEDGCMSAYDDYPASQLSETIVVFTEDSIENLRDIVNEHRAAGHAPPKSPKRTTAANRNRGPGPWHCAMPVHWNACPALMAPAA
nr:hypothetical protein [Mesorhizobium sp. L2C054A000]